MNSQGLPIDEGVRTPDSLRSISGHKPERIPEDFDYTVDYMLEIFDYMTLDDARSIVREFENRTNSPFLPYYTKEFGRTYNLYPDSEMFVSSGPKSTYPVPNVKLAYSTHYAGVKPFLPSGIPATSWNKRMGCREPSPDCEDVNVPRTYELGPVSPDYPPPGDGDYLSLSPPSEVNTVPGQCEATVKTIASGTKKRVVEVVCQPRQKFRSGTMIPPPNENTRKLRSRRGIGYDLEREPIPTFRSPSLGQFIQGSTLLPLEGGVIESSNQVAALSTSEQSLDDINSVERRQEDELMDISEGRIIPVADPDLRLWAQRENFVLVSVSKSENYAVAVHFVGVGSNPTSDM